MKTHRLGGLFACIAAVCLALAAPAHAQPRYPDRPIKVVLAVSAGASSDIAMRLIATAMGNDLQQPLVIENRPGAGGVLAAVAVAKAPADGYTLGLVTNSHVINPAVIRNIPYDTLGDFTPITLMAQGGMVLLAHPSLGVQSFKTLTALAKAQPGKLSYGSSGNGSLLHLYTAQIERDAGIELNHIPYKGLTAMVQDLVGGQIQIGMAALPATASFIQSGQLKPLAVTSKARMPGLPNVPTLAESGLPGYDNNGWLVLVGPKGLPPAIVARLHAAVQAALADPRVREGLAKASMDPTGASPEETARVLQADLERHMATAARIGLKPD